MNAIAPQPHAQVIVELDPETREMIERLASVEGRSIEQYVADAVRRAAESDTDYRAFIQEGIDAADRGELVSHEEVLAELDGMMAAHRARCTG